MYKRPWQDPVPPLSESVDLNVYYPCDDEDNGLVIAGWRGPSAIHEFYDLIGCTLLLKYLTDTSVSPLQKEFVECTDPYASNVGYNICENSVPLFNLEFSNVPKDKIPQIKDHLMQILKGIVSEENGIDMKRMNTIIHKYILETLSSLENNPHDAVAFILVGDILFGNNNEDVSTLYNMTFKNFVLIWSFYIPFIVLFFQLKQRLNQIDVLKKLMTEPESYWVNLLNKYFVKAPVVFSKGIPSIEKKLEMTQKEKERIKKQIESLGPKGLEIKEKELQEAIAENEVRATLRSFELSFF